jgi:hypothetical protein
MLCLALDLCISSFVCDFVFGSSLVHFSTGEKINTVLRYAFVCEGKRKIGTDAEKGWNNGG